MSNSSRYDNNNSNSSSNTTSSRYSRTSSTSTVVAAAVTVAVGPVADLPHSNTPVAVAATSSSSSSRSRRATTTATGSIVTAGAVSGSIGDSGVVNTSSYPVVGSSVGLSRASPAGAGPNPAATARVSPYTSSASRVNRAATVAAVAARYDAYDDYGPTRYITPPMLIILHDINCVTNTWYGIIYTTLHKLIKSN